MSYGEIWWFRRGGGATAFDDALVALHEAGMTVQNPVSGSAYVLDDEGSQVQWDKDEVRLRWLAGNAVTAQLWINSEVDVLVTAEHPQGLMTFDLDGMTMAEARRTVFAVANAAMSQPGTVAVVVDRELPDRGDDLLAAYGERSVQASLSFVPDLLLSSMGDWRFAVDVRPGSWLAQVSSQKSARDAT